MNFVCSFCDEWESDTVSLIIILWYWRKQWGYPFGISTDRINRMYPKNLLRAWYCSVLCMYNLIGGAGYQSIFLRGVACPRARSFFSLIECPFLSLILIGWRVADVLTHSCGRNKAVLRRLSTHYSPIIAGFESGSNHWWLLSLI